MDKEAGVVAALEEAGFVFSDPRLLFGEGNQQRLFGAIHNDPRITMLK
jgi:hypothetical protein